MIKDTSALKERIRENIQLQEKLLEEALKEGRNDAAMFHTGSMRGFSNSIMLIEIWEKGER